MTVEAKTRGAYRRRRRHTRVRRALRDTRDMRNVGRRGLDERGHRLARIGSRKRMFGVVGRGTGATDACEGEVECIRRGEE